MGSTKINPSEIEKGIKHNILSLFTKYDESKISNEKDFIEKIITASKDNNTETLVSLCIINNNKKFLFLLDSDFFIIRQENLRKYKNYFKNKIFDSQECEQEFKNYIQGQKTSNVYQQENNQNYDSQINEKLIECVIKKAQYRTHNIHNNTVNDEKYNVKLNYNEDDFIGIFNGVYYNTIDQTFNFIKYFNKKKGYERELEFYQIIANKFPFICKIFGIINQKGIVLEYIEGETLAEYAKNRKMIDLETNIYIFIQILLSVSYIHSQNLILRDLKPNNIMIDPISYHVYLIDFEHSKEMKITQIKEEEKEKENDDYDNEDENEEENTNIKNEDKTSGDIGKNYSAPEFEQNEYSEKSDSYSIGMIFHLLMTGINIDDYTIDLSKIKKNTLEVITKIKKFPQIPSKYFYIYEIYKNCCNILPQNRLSIKRLIRSFFNTENGELQNVMESITKKIISQFSHYLLSIFDYIEIINKYIDESFIWYSLGYIFYYYGNDIRFSEKFNVQFIDEFNEWFKKFNIELNKRVSIRFFQNSAKKGNRWAQYILGIIYYTGNITPRDVDKAIFYLKKASKQNLSRAQYFLGSIYYYDEFIIIDKKISKALKYLTLSANNYNSNAEYLLGRIYYEGIHVKCNVNKAFEYLKHSSSNNNSDADYFLGTIYFNGLYINKDIKKVIFYLDHAAQLNHSNAQYFLGELYYYGKYIQQDITKAIEYLICSAKNENKDAQYLLGQIYYIGKYVQRDFKKAINYFIALSNVNNEKAKNYLGIIYKNGGDGVEKNIVKSVIFLIDAIDQKSFSYSMYNLARFYYFDKENINTNESIKYLHKASEKGLEFANIFLFYIYTYDKKDAMMANKYRNQIPSIIQDILSEAPHEDEKAFLFKQFLQEFDLLNHNNDMSYLIEYLLTGNLNMKDDGIKPNNIEKRKLDQDFYDGFNDGKN